MAQEDPAVYPAEDDVAARCQDTDQPQLGPLQFSLQTIFVVTIVLSVMFAGLFGGSAWVALGTACCLLLAVPITLTVIAIYDSSYRRTFCIGAMFPAGAMFYSGLPNLILTFQLYRTPLPLGGAILAPGDRWRIGIALGIATVAILASGLLAVGVRWLVEAEQNSQPSRAVGREERQP